MKTFCKLRVALCCWGLLFAFNSSISAQQSQGVLHLDSSELSYLAGSSSYNAPSPTDTFSSYIRCPSTQPPPGRALGDQCNDKDQTTCVAVTPYVSGDCYSNQREVQAIIQRYEDGIKDFCRHERVRLNLTRQCDPSGLSTNQPLSCGPTNFSEGNVFCEEHATERKRRFNASWVCGFECELLPVYE